MIFRRRRINRLTGIRPNYNFEKAKLWFDEKNRPYFEVEDQGKRYRYVFTPNKENVDALVYEFSPSKKEWEEKETISDIGKKGWR
ncbi:MAG: hypothetical protein LBG87_06165 [Spirochaetaceae bacterium]|nr:hypothetical protein [Spirochaetaceae bacterium]